MSRLTHALARGKDPWPNCELTALQMRWRNGHGPRQVRESRWQPALAEAGAKRGYVPSFVLTQPCGMMPAQLLGNVSA
jgi:hypothetical protein